MMFYNKELWYTGVVVFSRACFVLVNGYRLGTEIHVGSQSMPWPLRVIHGAGETLDGID